MDDKACWTLNIASETNTRVRAYLTQRGMKNGDLSRFVEEAVKWRLLDLTLAEARVGFNILSLREMDDLIEEAVADAHRN